MVNAANFNLANIGGKQVLIASKSLLNKQTVPSNIVIQGSTINSTSKIGNKPAVIVPKVLFFIFLLKCEKK